MSISDKNFEVSMEPLTVRPDADALAAAWDQGWHEHYLEWERQRKDPTHPITRVNPYEVKELQPHPTMPGSWIAPEAGIYRLPLNRGGDRQ